MDKKIYIIFSGKLRYFEANYRTIEVLLKGYRYEFLFYPWSFEENNISKFKNLYKNSNFFLIKENNWLNEIRKIKFPDRANNINNFFLMWDALIQSFIKIKKKISRDSIIMRFRSDIIIHEKKVDFENLLLDQRNINIPDCYHWNGINDQVFIANVSLLNEFENFFKILSDFIKKDRFICPEYFFYKFLKTKKIKINKFKFDYQILKNKQTLDSPDLNNIDYSSAVPFIDKITIKYLKSTYKFKNFYEFYILKNKRNNNQNLFV